MGKKKRALSSGKARHRGAIVPRSGSISLKGVAAGVVAAIALAWLFFDSPWGMLMALATIPLGERIFRSMGEEKANEENVHALKELLLLLSSFLQAGISLENGFVEAEKELKDLIPGRNLLKSELHKMNQQVGVSVPVEQAFAIMAQRLDLEEAYEFADVLYYAKRLGGNYILNIQRTALKLEEKIGVSQEIDTMIAEKRFEFYIMMAMPLAILAYVKFTSMDFISGLYHSLAGVLVMGAALGFYGAMVWLGKKIIQIKV